MRLYPLAAPACFALVALLALSGCAKKPVLYPNAKLERTGEAQAQADIDACMQMARDHDAESSKAGKVAKSSAGGAALGAAGSAVWGAIMGRNVGTYAAAGAATGAVTGGLAGVFSSSDDPIFQNFVDRCLKEKGYEPMGWR
ncbi:MAG: hypothetical protein PWQ57_1398 [Desulfovibrionales bacterium]|jgi:uncharacterized protein YcfJ|nr:hypothetical protein [Desulfovibrionales bacterium]